MTPAQMIKPFLKQVDRERPDLRITNTALSCFELLQRTLYFAGPDWAFVGKTEHMDGGKVYPPELKPITLDLVRPDGQTQTVQIVALSMDAAWHLPTMRQVKVIGNSSANDDARPQIHGPANLEPYDIDPKDYRWHNPPIAQSFLNPKFPPLPPVVEPPPSTPPATRFSKEQAYAELQWLNRVYQDELLRPGGMVLPDRDGRMVADVQALGEWHWQRIIEGKSREDILSQIRGSYEWKAKHP